MTVVARGTIEERPWGRTLAALAARGFSGELRLDAGGKRYTLALEAGAAVGATSPLATDSAAKLALTAGLLTSTQIGEVSRRLAAQPGVDEVDVIAGLVALPADALDRLRRRALATKAIRPFAIEAGIFEVDDAAPRATGTAVDVRALIYLGARTHGSEGRLSHALGAGTMQLSDAGATLLPQLGLPADAQPAVDALRAGATAAELAVLGGDARIHLAVAYALWCTGGLANTAPRAAAAPTASTRAPAAAATPATPSTATATATAAVSASAPAPAAPRPRAQRSAKAGPPAASAEEIRALVVGKLATLNAGADHFALLDVTPQTAPDAIRKAYFQLARQLHPDRLAAAGYTEDPRGAQRLFAAINEAFRVLTDGPARADYLRVQKAGGKAALAKQEAEAEALALRILAAEEHFQIGEMALRREHFEVALRELALAVEKNPEEADHHALHGWAQFAAAADKGPVTAPARAALNRAAKMAPKSVLPAFYLGRIARILGDDAAALTHFRDVLARSPGHAEATSELRLLESRAKAPAEDKGRGLFGRLKK